jgi:glycosyltransferase involved in cell wall biosynthesis
LLYVGQLISRKGVHYLVEALEQLRARGWGVELELIGAGDREYEQSLRARVEALRLGDRVRFVGYVEDVAQLLDRYRAADIFTIASLGEGFPRVIYEAMMQGLPVVASGIETVKATLRDREEAILFTPGSIPALVDAVELVMRHAQLRQVLIRNGYAFAGSHVGAEHTGTQIMRLVQEYGGNPSPQLGQAARR